MYYVIASSLDLDICGFKLLLALGHSYVIKKGPGEFRQRAFSLSGGLMDLTNLGCILKVLITPTVKWHLNLPNCHGSIAKARIKGSGERASA